MPARRSNPVTQGVLRLNTVVEPVRNEKMEYRVEEETGIVRSQSRGHASVNFNSRGRRWSLHRDDHEYLR